MLFLFIYALFGEGVAAFEMEFSSGKGHSMYLFSKLFLADVYGKFCFHSLHTLILHRLP